MSTETPPPWHGLALPARLSLLPYMRRRRDVFPCPLPSAPRGACSPRRPGVGLGCTSEGTQRPWLPRQRPRPRGPLFPHGLEGQSTGPALSMSSLFPCPLQQSSPKASWPLVSGPSHLSDPLTLRPESGLLTPVQRPLPASTCLWSYCSQCSRLPPEVPALGFSSATASIGKPLQSLRVKPRGKAPLAATRHLLQGPGRTSAHPGSPPGFLTLERDLLPPPSLTYPCVSLSHGRDPLRGQCVGLSDSLGDGGPLPAPCLQLQPKS